MKRKPTTPGQILLEEFLKPFGITQKKLSDHIGCDYKVINRIVNGRAAVTPVIAIKLAFALETTPEFWLNAQMAMDLWELRTQKIPSIVKRKKSQAFARAAGLWKDRKDLPDLYRIS